jgi:hypothetical protein
MKRKLKPDARPIKKKPYRLNLKYKEKVKQELDKMLEAGVIFPVEESEWISPMVIQPKKLGEIRICLDLRGLNVACVHNPFPTPFTDEVLENVGGKEVYSFIDGFSGYHQVRIVEEDKTKTTFAIEWGCFSYNVMPFGLKNAPAGIGSPLCLGQLQVLMLLLVMLQVLLVLALVLVPLMVLVLSLVLLLALLVVVLDQAIKLISMLLVLLQQLLILIYKMLLRLDLRQDLDQRTLKRVLNQLNQLVYLYLSLLMLLGMLIAMPLLLPLWLGLDMDQRLKQLNLLGV